MEDQLWRGGTVYSAAGGPRGTIYSATGGPGGPSILLWMVCGDRFFFGGGGGEYHL